MIRHFLPLLMWGLVAAPVQAQADPARSSARPAPGGQTSPGYKMLVTLFEDWRRFQASPMVVGDLPQYTPSAIARQRAAFDGYRQRLAAITTRGWTIPDLVDRRIVEAEMNGLDFDLRVMRIWSKDPAFYKIITAGHEATGFPDPIQSPDYLDRPSAQKLATLRRLLRRAGAVYAQARTNLTDGTPDQWRTGIDQIGKQKAQLAAFTAAMLPAHPELAADFASAKTALDAFYAWTVAKLPTLPNRMSGLGIDDYNWYQKNVELIDLSWADQLAIAREQLDGYWARLATMENRDRALPPIVPIPDEAAHKAHYAEVVREYTNFLERERLRVVPDDEIAEAMRNIRPFETPAQWRGFQTVLDRNAMRTIQMHEESHNVDEIYLADHPPASPIRRAERLYFMASDREEGFADGMEITSFDAGYMDGRGREAEYEIVGLAKSSVNAIRNLMMAGNKWTLAQGMRFAGAAVPFDAAPADAPSELNAAARTYSVPTVGSGYLFGGLVFRQIVADRRRKLGAAFDLKATVDTIMATGVIPMSLVRWEITGIAPGETDLPRVEDYAR